MGGGAFGKETGFLGRTWDAGAGAGGGMSCDDVAVGVISAVALAEGAFDNETGFVERTCGVGAGTGAGAGCGRARGGVACVCPFVEVRCLILDE